MKNDAKLAGILHLSLVPLAGYAFGYVPAALNITFDNPTATVHNIAGAQLIFRSGIISHLISQAIVIFLMIVLYRLFKPIDESRSRIVVAMALVSVSIACAAEINQFAVLRVLDDAESVMLFLDLHRTGILIAQIFWAMWLLTMALLILKWRPLPAWVGIALIVGAAGYLFDSGAYLLGVPFAKISLFTFIGELTLPARLLFNGLDHGLRQTTT